MESFFLSFLGFGCGTQLTARMITSIPKLLSHHFDIFDNIFVIFKASDFSLIMMMITVFIS